MFCYISLEKTKGSPCSLTPGWCVSLRTILLTVSDSRYSYTRNPSASKVPTNSALPPGTPLDVLVACSSGGSQVGVGLLESQSQGSAVDYTKVTAIGECPKVLFLAESAPARRPRRNFGLRVGLPCLNLKGHLATLGRTERV